MTRELLLVASGTVYIVKEDGEVYLEWEFPEKLHKYLEDNKLGNAKIDFNNRGEIIDPFAIFGPSRPLTKLRKGRVTKITPVEEQKETPPTEEKDIKDD